MKTPADKTLAFTFKSDPVLPLKHRWTAVVTFPAGAGAETVLPIAVTDGEENPVGAGTLELAGRRLKVVRGKTEIVFADFIRGKHETGLWLHRRGVDPVGGGLTFA